MNVKRASRMMEATSAEKTSLGNGYGKEGRAYVAEMPVEKPGGDVE